MSEMKLFVWANPHFVEWGLSMLYAVAETEDQAREIAKSAPNYELGQFKQGGTPNAELGEPTRVIDLPCAEWVFWRE